MPIERREIQLVEIELRRAIGAYGTVTPGLLPRGEVLGVVVEETAQGSPCVTVSVRLAALPRDPPVPVRLNQESLLELLISFCKDEGIPMPQRGQKNACVVGSLLTLVIQQTSQS